jgi:hypothetical protein
MKPSGLYTASAARSSQRIEIRFFSKSLSFSVEMTTLASSRSKSCAPPANGPVRNSPSSRALRWRPPAAPQRGTEQALRIGQDVTALAVLGELDAGPIDEVQHEGIGRQTGELRLQQRQAQIVDRRHVCDHEGVAVSRRLRDDAVQVNAGAIAEQDFALFGIFQAVAQLGVDRGLQLRKIVHDLLGSFEHVRDRRHRRELHVETDVGIGFVRAFRNNAGIVGEAGLANIGDCRRSGTARGDQVPNEKPLLGHRLDARQTLRLDDGAAIGGNEAHRSGRHLDFDVAALSLLATTAV